MEHHFDFFEVLSNKIHEVVPSCHALNFQSIKVNQICLAVFEGERFRARITEVLANGDVSLFFMDYGNREAMSSLSLLSIPMFLQVVPALVLKATVSQKHCFDWLVYGSEFDAIVSGIDNSDTIKKLQLKMNVPGKFLVW